MKTWKSILISIFLSAFTLGAVYSQTTPKLAFTVGSGIARSGLPAQVGARVGLGEHFAINGQFGTTPWRREQLINRAIAQNVTLLESNGRGKPSYGLDARAFTMPNQSGLFAGAGFLRQGIEMTTFTKLNVERQRSDFASNASTLGGFLLGTFFDIILNSGGNDPVIRSTKAKINAFTVDVGYAHVLQNNNRFEFGLKFMSRNIKGVQYEVPTFDEPKNFNLDTFVQPYELTAEVRYIMPIL